MSISDPAKPQEAGVQARVTAGLRQRILAGEWSGVGRLPAERALAQEVGASRLSLRGALVQLAAEGLVRVRHGSGIEVLDPRRSASLDLFTWLLAAPENGGPRTFELFAEIVRLRRLVAVDTVLRAAERADESQVLELEGIAEEQAERTGDADAYLAGDAEYQRRVIRIAGGTAVELLFNSFQRVLDRQRELTLCFMGSLEEHHATYAALHALLRHPHPAELRSMAEAAQDMIESAGLERVRALCHGRTEP
jgi:DNA-binding FadR family transcriptional regulator